MSENEEIDPNSWMVTFADLVMLLLTFFVLLLTMSSMDTKKLKTIMTHFRESTGVLEFSGAGKVHNLSSIIHGYNDLSSILVVDQNALLNSIELSGILTDIMKKDIKKEISISDDERGVVLSFNENIFFESGKADLKKEIYPILDAIAESIESCPNEILIMGHTDNIPIKNDMYQSNWELSENRGLAVLEYFLKKKGISPSRFSVGGYGPLRPLHPNNTPSNRSLNRRVEIIFKQLEER